MVLCDSMVVPELRTFENHILIKDDSDADTEIMTTPEFWGSLTSGNIAYPGKHEAAIDSSSHMSTRSINSEDLESLQSVKQLQSDHRVLKVTQSLGDEPFRAARRERVVNDHEGTRLADDGLRL